MTLGHACIDNPSRHGCPARGKPRISTPRSSAFQPSQPTLLPPSRSPLRRAKEGRRSRLPAFPPLTRSVKGLRSHARPAPPLEPLNSWPLDPGPHFDLLTLRRFCFLRFCVLAFPPPPDRFTTPANRSGGMLCVWRAPSSRAPFFDIRRNSRGDRSCEIAISHALRGESVPPARRKGFRDESGREAILGPADPRNPRHRHPVPLHEVRIVTCCRISR